ncbi:hypothetical protein [Terriglobus roseus]|uniref:Uncharacterized protein n=1 Tax=Terriglobus roseus TaxID=392734 RepID=A0A1G7GCU5_9BACT|nr:hypothetical protein [Terriglobus roseus]SDE85972.1 hypothetical protein SAMN05444167_0650 [Terriglobus roseus]
MKFDVSKLVIMPPNGDVNDQVRMIFTGAGHGPLIDKLVAAMWQAALQGSEDKSHDAVLSRIEDAVIAVHQKLWQLYDDASRPHAEILFALHTYGEVNLYRATGPIVSGAISSHACIGIGGELGNFITAHFRSPNDDLESDVSTALYIVENAKRYVDGCGGETQIAALMRDGTISKMYAWEAGKMAEILFSMGAEVFSLFALASNPKTTQKDLRDSWRSVLKYVNEDRIKLRQEVRHMIKVSSSLKKSLQIFYRRIMWPPTRSTVSSSSEDQQ